MLTLMPVLLAQLAAPGGCAVTISADRTTIGMGRLVTITCEARLGDGSPAVGWEMLPYVDGKRWGAHYYTDADGRATIPLPIPRPGLREIVVAAGAPPSEHPDSWIWDQETLDLQTVRVRKDFELPSGAESAALWFCVDDHGVVRLNGAEVYEFVGWHNKGPVTLDPTLLHPGTNTLEITADNGTGPAGILARLEVGHADGTASLVTTDDTWTLVPEEAPVRTLGTLLTGVVQPDNWPGGNARRLITGATMPADALCSNALVVRVERRELAMMPEDPDCQIGVQWEPWFTPHNAWWTTAEAVPTIGYYSSFEEDVVRQHVIWLMESGTDFLLADWSNHIWQSPTWDSRAPGSNEILLATTLTLETLAKMRDEGIRVPRIALLCGMSWTEKGEVAVNGMLDWIWHNYIRNPRFEGLYQLHEGKPLVLLLDLPGAYLAQGRVLDPEGRFTLRYTGSQLDKSHQERQGFWSWMDTGVPPVTFKDGVAEAVTVAFGYFSSGGWTKEDSAGLRGGATILETFEPALRERPKVVFLHQFNEFAGQPEGQGHGPTHDSYYDTYSSELTDDYEPTALGTPGYRSPSGGWGFHYLNLSRALVDLLKQPEPETTVLVAESPRRDQRLTGDSLTVRWLTVGKAPASVRIEWDGAVVLRDLVGSSAELSLVGVAPGPHTIRVVAEGTRSRYLLSTEEDCLPLADPVEAYVNIPVIRE